MSTTELYRTHRPTSFKGVLGQPEVVSRLQEMVKSNRVPHAMLFCGGSGCGKTTLARIMASKLGCGASDFTEMNCADFRGIDMVRDIQRRMGMSPISGTCRIWLIDEAHQMTGAAQDAFLKILEDTPAHVYFIICTTDPLKLKVTFRGRCTEFKLKELPAAKMKELLAAVADKEGFNLDDEVADKVVELALGSARKALVLLNSILGMPDDAEAQKNALESSDQSVQAINLARLLLAKAPWAEVAAVLKALDEEPESLRRMVLGYASNVLLGGGKMAPRAFLLLDTFQHPFYDSGKPGLVTACYAVCSR